MKLIKADAFGFFLVFFPLFLSLSNLDLSIVILGPLSVYPELTTFIIEAIYIGKLIKEYLNTNDKY